MLNGRITPSPGLMPGLSDDSKEHPELRTAADRMKATGIVQDGDPVLRRQAVPFRLPDEAAEAEAVIAGLFGALQRAGEQHVFSKGMGVAAPQIGISRAAAVVLPPDSGADPRLRVPRHRAIMGVPGSGAGPRRSSRCVAASRAAAGNTEFPVARIVRTCLEEADVSAGCSAVGHLPQGRPEPGDFIESFVLFRGEYRDPGAGLGQFGVLPFEPGGQVLDPRRELGPRDFEVGDQAGGTDRGVGAQARRRILLASSTSRRSASGMASIFRMVLTQGSRTRASSWSITAAMRSDSSSSASEREGTSVAVVSTVFAHLSTRPSFTPLLRRPPYGAFTLC